MELLKPDEKHQPRKARKTVGSGVSVGTRRTVDVARHTGSAGSADLSGGTGESGGSAGSKRSGKSRPGGLGVSPRGAGSSLAALAPGRSL